MEEKLFEAYSYFFECIKNKKPKSLTKPEKSSVKSFSDFLKSTVKDLNPQFLYHYFSFQFYYWQDKNTKNEMSITWIIGPKAFDRWSKKKDNWKWFVSQNFWNQNDKLDYLVFNGFFNSNCTKGTFLDYNLLSHKEELQKSVTFNTEMGFKICINNTSLINPNSPICEKCDFANSCKNLLERNYPTIYKMRYEI